MKKVTLIDIGELGWSLEISAYARWLRKYHHQVEVITYADRTALYPNCQVTCIGPIKNAVLDGMGVLKVDRREVLRDLRRLAKYKVPPEMTLRFSRFWGRRQIFKAYRVVAKKKPCILIFPRARPWKHARRNLPREYYTGLISRLHPLRVVAIGKPGFSYKLDVSEKLNFHSFVQDGTTIQNVIDYCGTAYCTIGSQSALPKLALLQGVPTFMIGHQKDRHVKRENWMSTEAGFYELPTDNYKELDIEDCISKTIAWVSRFLPKSI